MPALLLAEEVTSNSAIGADGEAHALAGEAHALALSFNRNTACQPDQTIMVATGNTLSQVPASAKCSGSLSACAASSVLALQLCSALQHRRVQTSTPCTRRTALRHRAHYIGGQTGLGKCLLRLVRRAKIRQNMQIPR